MLNGQPPALPQAPTDGSRRLTVQHPEPRPRPMGDPTAAGLRSRAAGL